MSNTCETCKHWVNVTDFYGDYPNKPVEYLGKCLSHKLLRVLTADGASDTVKSWNKLPTDSLGAIDAEDYWVRILVGKDFGCIHHTTKEQSDGI